MNRFLGLFGAMAFGVVVGFANPASAITADTLIGSSAEKNMNDAEEEAFMEGLAGVDLILDKTDNNIGWTADNDLDTTGDGVGDGATGWVLDVDPDEPGYFLVKFGGGNLPDGTDLIYVFENIAEMTKLAFTDLSVNNITFENIDRLSHYTAAVIPLPAAGFLLLGAIAGLSVVGWRRRRQMAVA